MADQLFPTYEVPEIVVSGSRYDTEYRKAPKWDPDAGDFVLDGAGKIVEADGEEGYMIWCLKMSQTERFKCLSYPDELGVEMENAVYDDDHATVESMMKRTVTEALMVNPRTRNVDNFKFEWDGDTVYGTCTVTARDMDDFTLKF